MTEYTYFFFFYYLFMAKIWPLLSLVVSNVEGSASVDVNDSVAADAKNMSL